MKKVNKLFAGLVGIAATASMAYAAVSAAAPAFDAPMRAAAGTTASAYWALGENKDYANTEAGEIVGNAFASTKLEISNLALNRSRTLSEVKFTTYTVTNTTDESSALIFTITPAEGYTFQPEKVEFKAARCGTDSGKLYAKLTRGTEEELLVDGVLPNRNGNSNTAPNPEGAPQWSMYTSNLTMTASSEPIVLRIYVTDTNREYAFSQIGIYGKAFNGEGGDTPVEPVEPHFFTMPGTFAVPESATTDDNYDFSGDIGVEGNEGDKNFCSAYDGRSLTFKNVFVEKAGAYKAIIPTDYSYGNSFIEITVADAESGATEASYKGSFAKNNSKWEPVEYPLTGKVNEGLKNVTFRFTLGGGDRFAGNFKAPTFEWTGEGEEIGGGDTPVIPAGYEAIPGTVHVNKGAYEGSLRLENNGANVGYTKIGDKATYKVYATEDGVYRLDVNFTWFQNPADFVFTVRDVATGTVEATSVYPVTGVHNAQVVLLGLVTKGEKELVFEVTGTPSNFIANWVDFDLVKVGEKFAAITEFTAEGCELTKLDGYDYAFNVPFNYSASTVDFKVAASNAVVTVKSGDTTLTPANGVYSVPTPANNESVEVTVALAVEEGVYSGKTEYKARFFRLGDVTVSGVTVDGESLDALVAALNESAAATLADHVYTAMPVVKAMFVDGSSVDATGTLEGTKATYAFTGKLGDNTKNYTLTIDGVHIYTPDETDLTATVRYDDACKQADNSWSNGLYTIKPANDGWGGTQFKFSTKNGNSVHIDIPSPMKVKQIILGGLKDNYAPGKITSITSEGATVWTPTASEFVNGGSGYALVSVVDNHKAGTGFDITFEGGNQPVWWFDFVYAEEAPGAPAPVLSTNTDLEGRNHTVVSLTFDREMKDCTVDFNGSAVTAYGGSGVLRFPLWDMEYNREYTLTIPAGKLTDKFGSTNAEAVTYTFTTGSEAVVEAMAADRFTVVSNGDELKAAVAALSATNSKATDALSVIYLVNGDYDLGHDTNGQSSTQALHLNKLFNVALIGESEEGVLIHGTRYGISYAVLSTRYSTNIYMENLTIRNDADFGRKHDAGVAVAHYGGNLDVMRNVTMQSHQDTQVTGERGYYYNCTFHGKTDYICGGGDHFYDHCHFVMTEAGGVIAAPSTSTTYKHGYVFSHCDISGEGSYTLGRPWQNEPRAFWLHTTMHTLPSEAGWTKMSNLVTYFYEYGSMDKDGNILDLSKRTNSPTSINKYTPILPEQYVDYFTVRNVLGSTTSWDAAEHTAELAAPVPFLNEGKLSWEPVKGAIGYIVYSNGAFALFTPGTEVGATDLTPSRADEAVVYTVKAINANGVTGKLSEGHKTGTSAIEAIDAAADTEAEYYNLQGVRVANPSAGVYIRIQSGTATKVIVK